MTPNVACGFQPPNPAQSTPWPPPCGLSAPWHPGGCPSRSDIRQTAPVKRRTERVRTSRHSALTRIVLGRPPGSRSSAPESAAPRCVRHAGEADAHRLGRRVAAFGLGLRDNGFFLVAFRRNGRRASDAPATGMRGLRADPSSGLQFGISAPYLTHQAQTTNRICMGALIHKGVARRPRSSIPRRAALTFAGKRANISRIRPHAAQKRVASKTRPAAPASSRTPVKKTSRSGRERPGGTIAIRSLLIGAKWEIAVNTNIVASAKRALSIHVANSEAPAAPRAR